MERRSTDIPGSHRAGDAHITVYLAHSERTPGCRPAERVCGRQPLTARPVPGPIAAVLAVSHAIRGGPRAGVESLRAVGGGRGSARGCAGCCRGDTGAREDGGIGAGEGAWAIYERAGASAAGAGGESGQSATLEGISPPSGHARAACGMLGDEAWAP